MDTQSQHVSVLIEGTLLGNFGKKKLVLIKFLLYFIWLEEYVIQRIFALHNCTYKLHYGAIFVRWI